MRCKSAVISVVFDGIQVPGRLVAEQDLRIVDQRSSDGCALLLAARKLVGIHAALVRQADEVEDARHLPHHVAGMRPGYLHREGDVLPNGFVGKQFEILEDDAEVAAQRRNSVAAQTVDANAVHDDFAGRRSGLPVKQTQETRFAGSRMTDEEDEVALADLEAYVVQGAHAVRIDERNAAQDEIIAGRGVFRRSRGYTSAMDFDLTDEQKAIQGLAREFARDEVRPRAEEMDREERFPYELIAKMAELGFMGLPFPEEYGGAGADTVSYALAVMEIARADASTAITMAAHVSLGATPFYLFGTEAQKQKYLMPLAQGEMLWGFGLTEPSAGSDAGNVQTKAALCDGKWVINGTKAFITNSGTEISGGTTITAVTGRRPEVRARFRTSSFRKRLSVSPAAANTARWGGALRTRASSRLPMPKCPKRTCSAREARGTVSFSRSSTAAESPSRRSRSG